jgi:hypothetical protein
LLLKESKTDKTGKGVLVYIGCSSHVVCAYCLMVKFTISRPKCAGTSPLFSNEKIPVLRKTIFVNATRLVLATLGLDPSK